MLKGKKFSKGKKFQKLGEKKFSYSKLGLGLGLDRYSKLGLGLDRYTKLGLPNYKVHKVRVTKVHKVRVTFRVRVNTQS